MRVVHLTPFGLGRPLSRDECRAARALVAESIRTRLTEYRARHLFARPPTQLAVLGQRVVATRRTLFVVSDGASSDVRILLAATARASTSHGGLSARVLYAVVRRLRRGAVMVITALAVLAARHGHTGFDALVESAVVVAVTSSPVLTSVRVRWGGRALAWRAARLMPELGDELHGVTVLHDFGLPRALGGLDSLATELEAIGAALTLGVIPTCIAQPCCDEVGQVFATWARGLLVPQHAQPERSVLVFPVGRSVTVGHADGEIVPIDRAARSRRVPLELPAR